LTVRYVWLLAIALALTVAARAMWPGDMPPGSAAPAGSAGQATSEGQAGQAGQGALARGTAADAAVVEAVRASLDAGRLAQVHPGPHATEWRQLAGMYQASGARPLWLDAAGALTTDARAALSQLERASEEGLAPEDYAASALASRAAALTPDSSTDAARFDVDLTAGLQLYLRDLHVGRVDPRTIGFKMTAARDEHDFAEVVRTAATSHTVPDLSTEWAPKFAVYRNLRTALAKYRQVAADPALATPPPKAPTVHRGEPYAGIDVLTRLLVALGDLPAGEAPGAGTSIYDGALATAVTHFQDRHGFEPDGVLGRATQDALRVPLAWRVRQLELALERLRWLPQLGPGPLIAVNIPMFRLWAWDALTPDGVPTFETRVIVGQALDTETPVFIETLEHVIFRPYWNIPRSIVNGEILPAIAKDANYLQKHDMEIVAASRPVPTTPDTLARLKQGGLSVRQRPGPKNSLGLVKFVFPNDENVYLHDTPAQSLFERSRRDFSHGCVRVQNPAALASWVLHRQEGFTPEQAADAMKGDTTRQVNLREPIPVILFYITAVVTPADGTVHFAADIYKHDDRLDQALRQRSRR
jgi:murein L,D-transpeptidase YcbB/YkuD